MIGEVLEHLRLPVDAGDDHVVAIHGRGRRGDSTLSRPAYRGRRAHCGCPPCSLKVLPLLCRFWEQANGPIPDGCYVSPLDGNRRNTDLANLKLVTKDALLGR
ncbi:MULTISPECIES: HNH endonuclease signature motif containing protein [unclassified Pseudomonas]|uniref:HNH endonuclease signature motif containing protein n=1 Tax=unclassified Pseudomonas TaxID=196821 RepID=UPI00319DDECE